ncbi:MAG: sigma-70 family RNA polymerase sigma factor [Opitutus sp.]|nr:sigma-70 family RNA polymerase sigma factor [Opitutus sp.]
MVSVSAGADLSPAPRDSPAGSADHLQWFAEHVYAHDRKLKSYLQRSFPSLRDIDDIAQESYLRVWRRHLERPVIFSRAFLYKVAARLALDAVRRTRNCPIEASQSSNVLNGIDEAATVIERVCVTQEIELLYEAIGGLPARCREIFLLRKIHGLSQKEIAWRLCLSEQTVQGQASRGLRRCRQLLARRGLACSPAPGRPGRAMPHAAPAPQAA